MIVEKSYPAAPAPMASQQEWNGDEGVALEGFRCAEGRRRSVVLIDRRGLLSGMKRSRTKNNG